MIFSHAGEIGATCDVCGRKYLHKHFGAVRAGHLTVCCDAHCIIDAMHSTGVPRLSISEDMIVNMISKEFNIPESVVRFHITLAKSIYTIMINPNLVDFEMVHLVEAIIHIEFGEYETDVVEYAKTIDVMLKPYGVPTGRKSIDTNYPLASVVSMSLNQNVVPGFLDSLRTEMHSGNYHHEMEGREFLLQKIALLSGIKISGCPEIPTSKKAIILGQVYMEEMHYTSIFDQFDRFREIVETWEYQTKFKVSEIRAMHKEAVAIAHDCNKTLSERADGIYNIICNTCK